MGTDMSHSVEQRLRQYQQDFCKQRRKLFKEIWTLYPKGKAQVLQVVMSGIRLNDGRMALHVRRPPASGTATGNAPQRRSPDAHNVMISLFSERRHSHFTGTPLTRAACPKLETRFEEPVCRSA